MRQAKENNAKTIVITSNSQSALGKAADYTLCYSTLIDDDLRQLHIARICELAVIGLLQSAIMGNESDRIIKNILATKKKSKKAELFRGGNQILFIHRNQ